MNGILSSCVMSLPNQVMNYREASTNQTINEKVIKFLPLYAPPYVATYFDIYRMDDIPQDMVCGALMKLLREMSIKYDYSILRGAIEIDLVDLIDNYDQLNIVLFPMSKSFFDEYKESLISLYENESTLDSQYKISRALGLQSEGNILCFEKTGQWPGFKFILSFEPSVWYSLIAALLVLTVIKTITEMKGLSQLGANFWSFFSLTFGVTNSQNKHSIHSTFLTILWLFSVTVMLSAFSGVLLAFFMEPIPVIVIDSWEDLFQAKEVKIAGLHPSFIERYIEDFQYQEEMARDFGERYYNFMEIEDQQTGDKYDTLVGFTLNKVGLQLFYDHLKGLFKLLKSGQFVFSAEKYQLEHMVLIWPHLFGDGAHISRSGGGISPYFMSVHPNQFTPNLESDLNQIIIRLIESGIYDYWLSQDFYDPSGELRAQLYHDETEMAWGQIYFIKVQYVFNLWAIGIAITIIVFIIHLIFINFINFLNEPRVYVV